MQKCVLRLSWILLLFCVCDSVPVKNPSPQTGGSFQFSGGSSDGGFASEQDVDAGRFASETLAFQPGRPFPRQAWSSQQVPLGMVERRPLFPSSYLVHFSSGYQRARDSSSHAKYSQDVFDHIALPEGPKGGFPVGQKS